MFKLSLSKAIRKEDTFIEVMRIMLIIVFPLILISYISCNYCFQFKLSDNPYIVNWAPYILTGTSILIIAFAFLTDSYLDTLSKKRQLRTIREIFPFYEESNWRELVKSILAHEKKGNPYLQPKDIGKIKKTYKKFVKEKLNNF